MKHTFNLSAISDLQQILNNHPIYRAVTGMERLRMFMSNHIYSVWDFMSLLKFLEMRLAPSRTPWTPVGSTFSRRFINAIVLEEESDLGLAGTDGEETYASHFELYQQAMMEVGAGTDGIKTFIHWVETDGVHVALRLPQIPAPARNFVMTTFSFIATEQAHLVAAAFALGREKIIPGMFRALLAKMDITKEKAPAFHFYLERHIHLDEDFHGPLAMRMLNELCENDPKKVAEAEEAARKALKARITFWDGVLEELEKVPSAVSAC